MDIQILLIGILAFAIYIYISAMILSIRKPFVSTLRHSVAQSTCQLSLRSPDVLLLSLS